MTTGPHLELRAHFRNARPREIVELVLRIANVGDRAALRPAALFEQDLAQTLFAWPTAEHEVATGYRFVPDDTPDGVRRLSYEGDRSVVLHAGLDRFLLSLKAPGQTWEALRTERARELTFRLKGALFALDMATVPFDYTIKLAVQPEAMIEKARWVIGTESRQTHPRQAV